MAELLVDTKLACDRAGAAGADRVDEQARVRLHARYQRLLAYGLAANLPKPASAGAASAARPLPGCRPGSTPIVTCAAMSRPHASRA